ncbi:hypothetical protein Ddc_15571 [Ditylenchus destructor]|nr:hypothetical protein Ddc_15571 [Ditylenchus destructor]
MSLDDKLRRANDSGFTDTFETFEKNKVEIMVKVKRLGALIQGAHKKTSGKTIEWTFKATNTQLNAVKPNVDKLKPDLRQAMYSNNLASKYALDTLG